MANPQEPPKKFNDPYWTQLSASTEKELGLPAGLLTNIVIKGERTNNDQVSEAGARTVFQITPTTQKAAIKKYGIDPYLSPENAARVAGLLLKDSLARNNNDVSAAVAEYHGGVDRTNWGPRTRAYVSRVVGGQQPAQRQAPQSTFERAKAMQQAQRPVSNAIQQVYDAYKSGRMTPDEMQQFEADVQSGQVMLPRGATLGNKPAAGPLDKPEPVWLPQEITDAYRQGAMSEQERADLEADMRAGLVKLPPYKDDLIDAGSTGTRPTEQGIIKRPKEQSLMDKAIGVGEAGLSAITGATGGVLGTIHGAGTGIIDSMLNGTFGTQEAVQRAQDMALAGGEALTYTPRTEAGQQYTQAIGEATAPLMAVAPLAELSVAGQMAGPAAGQVVNRASQVTQAVKPAVVNAVETVKAPVVKAADTVKSAAGRAAEAVGLRNPEPMPTAGTGASAGAAAVDAANLRRARAAELGFTGEKAPTEGMATRDFSQQRFEQEAAKNPELGAPIRQRMENINRHVGQVLESWLDETGAQAPDVRSTGIAIDKALREAAARDKTKYRIAYKEAEKAGEMDAPADISPLADYLNTNRAERAENGIMSKVQRQLDVLEVSQGSFDNGTLQINPVTINQAEAVRRFINRNMNVADPNDVRIASEMKRIIDASTESVGGKAYQRARKMRQEYAQKYENRAVIDNLLSKKRGMEDRKVAIEDIANRIVLNGSLDDLKHAGKVLKLGGEAGKQAWRELQGHVIRYIKDQITKNVSRNSAGEPIISPAALDKVIRTLDSDGKLDYLFGKKGAEKLRLLNDIAKDVFTSPPGAVNTSNTASVLLAAMDMMISGSAGMPLPVTSGLRMLVKHVKDKKLRVRIEQALSNKE